MTLDIDNIGGELVGSCRGKVLRFPAGRVCQEPGCRTRLSVYNSRARCALHDFDAALVSVRPPAPIKNVHHFDGHRDGSRPHRPRHHVTGSAA